MAARQRRQCGVLRGRWENRIAGWIVRCLRCAAMLSILAVALPLAPLPVAAHGVTHKDLDIVHPYTVEPEPGAGDEARVSMVIRNRGTEPERLLAAETTLAKSAVLLDGDKPLGPSGLVIAPGAEVTLGGRGPHIQLRGIDQTLHGYEMFPLWLTFERAGRIEIEVLIESSN